MGNCRLGLVEEDSIAIAVVRKFVAAGSPVGEDNPAADSNFVVVNNLVVEDNFAVVSGPVAEDSLAVVDVLFPADIAVDIAPAEEAGFAVVVGCAGCMAVALVQGCTDRSPAQQSRTGMRVDRNICLRTSCCISIETDNARDDGKV